MTNIYICDKNTKEVSVVLRFMGYTALSTIAVIFLKSLIWVWQNLKFDILDVCGILGLVVLVALIYFIISDKFNEEIKKVNKKQYQIEFFGIFILIFIIITFSPGL
ncbi:MAG: hypothetical protein WC095_02260 [Candidatus Paceibacterota bacterium]